MAINYGGSLTSTLKDPTESIGTAASEAGQSVGNAWTGSVTDHNKAVGNELGNAAATYFTGGLSDLAKSGLGDNAADWWKDKVWNPAQGAWKKAEDMFGDLFNPSGFQDISGMGGLGANNISKVGGQLANRAPAWMSGGNGGAGGFNSNPSAYQNAQMALINQLQRQSSGTGPSVAANQLRVGQEANLAATIAAANSARGGANPGLARAAMQSNAEAQGRAAQEAATARLQEQLSSQGLLGTTIAQGQSSAIQQQEVSNQLEVAKNQLAAQYAQMGLDAEKANQQAEIQMKQLIQSGAIDMKKLQMAALTGDREFLGNMFTGAGTLASGIGTIFG